MSKMLRPDFIFESVADLTSDFYLKNGIKAVIFDIDDTLCPHGSEAPTEDCRAAVSAALSAGAGVGFISNNKAKRNEFFTPIVLSANKPSKRGYLEICKRLGVKPCEALSVGDQLFTDVWGAKRADIRSALVTPISNYKNPIIAIKRVLEKPLLRKYKGKSK
ncbi:MAG: HAD hydrolase-like protein [Clostridia bacterium]|nr:HAD hydrolase-like protein [Clostridia bacterium]